jgi:hypothetical protein
MDVWLCVCVCVRACVRMCVYATRTLYCYMAVNHVYQADVNCYGFLPSAVYKSLKLLSAKIRYKRWDQGLERTFNHLGKFLL